MTTVKAPVSNTQEERPTRKLTLTLGQSAHSVKMHPALIDQIDEEAFINLISAYMDQPFDFTYQQDGLIFNVTLTHTLTLVARQKELAAIDVELSPLFEDDFEKAFQLLMDWDAFFNGAGLVKLNKSYYVPLGQLKAKFDAVHNEKFGVNTGGWSKGGSQFSIGMDRFERSIFNLHTKKTVNKPVYKVSINISSIGLRDAER
ncbi:MAG TPA: hypothetical protein PK129_16460 [Cellvibrionaceae bacterium]|nr:hypothetical protein [Cellvibrionaceae bacterium]